jgi:hypothetical protein
MRDFLRTLAGDAPEPLPVQAAVALPVQVVQGELLKRATRPWLRPAVIGLAIVLGVLIGRFAFDSQGDSRPERTALPVTGGSTTGPPSANEVTPTVDAGAMTRLAPVTPQVAIAPVAATRSQIPLASGLVAFDSGTMAVSRRAVVAPVPVRHFSTVRRSVIVAWRVADGSAVAGRDYGGPQSGVARFSEGHTFRMIYVPILGNAAATGDRSFTVELTDVSPGASLGTTHRIVVTILGDA